MREILEYPSQLIRTITMTASRDGRPSPTDFAPRSSPSLNGRFHNGSTPVRRFTNCTGVCRKVHRALGSRTSKLCNLPHVRWEVRP